MNHAIPYHLESGTESSPAGWLSGGYAAVRRGVRCWEKKQKIGYRGNRLQRKDDDCEGGLWPVAAKAADTKLRLGRGAGLSPPRSPTGGKNISAQVTPPPLQL